MNDSLFGGECVLPEDSNHVPILYLGHLRRSCARLGNRREQSRRLGGDDRPRTSEGLQRTDQQVARWKISDIYYAGAGVAGDEIAARKGL